MTDNVYSRLLKARNEIQQTKMEKTGLNKFSNYNYFTLEVIVPVVEKICEKNGILPVMDFGTGGVVNLKIVNVDKPEEVIEFSSMFKVCELKGQNTIQCIMSSHTYFRRAMYLIAFDIVEVVDIDSLLPEQNQEVEPPKPVNKVKDEQLNKIKANVKNEEVKKALVKAISEENVKKADDLSDEAIKRISELIK